MMRQASPRCGVVKVLAKGRATSETQQGEIDHSVHTSLYRPARLPLCPAHFGVATKARRTRCKFPCGIACGEPCGLRSEKMTSMLAAVRAGVRDFEDRIGAIFPACFLPG